MRRGCVHPWLLATFVVGLVASAGITAWLGEARARTEREIFDEAYAVAERRTVEIARRIDERLRGTRRVAASIADELSDGTLTPADLDARLAQVMTDDPTLFSVGVAYEPAAGPAGPGLYAPHMVRDQDIVHAGELDFDYTAFEHRWYGEPMLKGARWNEPYLDPTEDTVVVGFGAPFRTPGSTDDGNPDGLVLARYSADEIRRDISEIGLGGGGYPFLISPEGRFIVHPIDDYMRAGQTVFELAWERDDTVLHATAIRAIGGENGYVDHVDSVTGQVSRILYQRIAEAGWSLGVVFFTADIGNDDARRHRLLLVVVAGVATLCFLIASVVALLRDGEQAAWAGVCGGSLALASAIGAIWFIAGEHQEVQAPTTVEVIDHSSVSQFVAAYFQRSEELSMEAPVFIPTGVFVQSIEFTSSTNVEVTGYLWQRYHRGRNRDLNRGFILPEAIEATVNEVYRYDTGEFESIGWYFVATLRQNFSYEQYPFDRQEVWLRFWHTDFARNVVLVPDLDAYDITNPGTLPGVERDFVLPGWSIAASGFNYRSKNYNANFGIDDYVGQDAFPELHFSIHLRRQFLSPFVSKFIPLFVVAAMLFALLLINSKHEHRSDWFGFKAMDVVLGCAALFFVLIFEHAALREELGSPTVMYLENLYFGLYLATLFVTMNAIMFATTGWRLIQFRDNLLPKLLFWPLYLTGLFVVTMVAFY